MPALSTLLLYPWWRVPLEYMGMVRAEQLLNNGE